MSNMWADVQRDIGFPPQDIPIFEEHQKHMTADVLFKGDVAVACVRYNISRSGRVAYILDLYCKSHGMEAMRLFCRNGRARFPSLRYIKFERGWKYKRSARVMRLDDLIKE
jgi:hypothetical protein